jgi:hypothetical protein
MNNDLTPHMRELIATAERLRAVRAACRQFLALWALDDAAARIDMPNFKHREQLADPMNHDWSILYHGSVLDD